MKGRRKIEPVGVESRYEELGDSEISDPIHDDLVALGELTREARLTPALLPGEQEKLLERAVLGDVSSQERLVAVNLTMVIRVALERGEQALSVPDLVQEGSIGLVEAVRTFADSGESDFARFAESRIGAQMDAAIEAEAAAVRDAELLIAAATDYERTQWLLRRERGREATEQELAEKLEWTIDRTRYVAQVVADARRRHDEELLAFVDPEVIDFDGDELPELDG
jgi:DNA-directed RNA polymerase sigma subunit (sigma70/sigma32)